MTDTTLSIVERRGERGSALIAVLLLLMMMTGLAGALALGSQTESYVSRNQNSGAQAQAAAEAGLNHAVELAVSYIFEWKSNGFGSYGEAVNALLAGPDGATGNPDDDADNGSLGTRAGIDAAEDLPAGEEIEVAGSQYVRYEAILMDDDDSAPGAYPENANPYSDLNERLIVRATGYGPDNSKVVLEAIISPAAFGAIVTEGDLTVSGSVDVIVDDPNHPDPDGAIHTNSDLTVEGTSTTINGTVTATGEYDVTDPDLSGSGSSARVEIPAVSAADYAVWADYILTDAGTMVNASTGATVCTWSAKTSCNSWNWNSGTGTWSISGSTATAGTYYVEGHASISGSPGSAKAPVAISIIAEGNINISGSPKLAPDTPELLFVTDMDLKMLGSLDIVGDEIQAQGQMLVREQVDIGGNVSLLGQLLVQDADDSVSSLVTSNHIHGSVDITYSGGLGGSSFTVTGWRDVRDDE
jgi:hypothetical protein